MAKRDKITVGLSEALDYAKGSVEGARITICSATEFYIGGVRFPSGKYELKRIEAFDPATAQSF